MRRLQAPGKEEARLQDLFADEAPRDAGVERVAAAGYRVSPAGRTATDLHQSCTRESLVKSCPSKPSIGY